MVVINVMEEAANFKRFLLVYNPGECRLKARERLIEVIKRLFHRDCYFEVIESKELPHRKNLESFDCVVAVGGDGTVFSVVPVISKYDIKLGIIPCGTANLFAAGLFIPANIDKAIDILFTGNSTRVDIGKAGEQYFALRVGVGYDADVVNGAHSWVKDKLGYLAYFIEGVKSSFHLSLKKMKVTIDGKLFEVNANSIIVANSGNMFRNIFKIAPHCSTVDGKLDVFILMSKNFGDFLKVLWQIITKSHASNSSVMYEQGHNIKIETLNTNTHIDGEPVKRSYLDIWVIPKALKVQVPAHFPTPALEKVYVEV